MPKIAPESPDSRFPPLSLPIALALGLAGTLVAIASAWVYAPWRLAPLLLAQTLVMAALARPASAAGTLALRSLAHLLASAAFCACVWLLTALPLAALAQAPSLGGSLLLSVALVLALAVLWRTWPLFALLFAGHACGRPAAALRAVVRHGLRLTGEPEVLFGRGLPAAACLLVLALAALSLAGLTPLLPTAWLLPATLGYALVLAPAGLLLLRACAAVERRGGARGPLGQRLAPPAASTPAPRNFTLEPEETRPGAREAALVEAARNGECDRALALLAAGADADARPAPGERDRRSALVLATLLPDTRLLRALIARGADLRGGQDALPPLLAATRDSVHGRPEAVLTLLTNGADPRVADADGNTPLHWAALSRQADVAAMLLDAQAAIDALNRAGQTPLAMACRAGNGPLVAFLLGRGAQLEPPGGAPVIVAAAGGAEDSPQGVELLLRHKARVDARDSLGRTALMVAALEGHAQIASVLLAAGASADLADRHGTTALMEAARAGANAVIAALASHQPATAPRDIHGRDALALACQSPRAGIDTVRALLALGADPQARGSDGRSAIDHAAGAGRWNLVAVLDPATPLPASHCDDLQPEPGADDPAHLLDALRFGHWAAVSGFRRCVRDWPQATLAGLYLALADDDHAAARRWLLDHGLQAEAHGEDGRRLLDALYECLPQAVSAIHDVLLAGATPAGAGGLARALAGLGGAAEGAALVPLLLDGGGDPFGADATGMTPLHHAAAGGLGVTLALLLERGCDPNVRDREGQTPLHLALRHDPGIALPMLRNLLRHGADPEAAAANGETPLGLALARDEQALAQWLRWSTWPLPGRRLRATDLPAAACVGDAAAVERLLQFGFAVDTRDAQGASALLRACGGGHAETARVLLAAGADPAQTTASGATPLSAAISARQADLVRLLVAQGAPLDQRLRGGATALLVACALGLAPVAELLLEAGADIQAVDERGRGALHAACQYCFGSDDSLAGRRLLDLLLAHGARADARDSGGASPLLFMLGAHAGPGSPCDATHLGALLPVLLDAGAPINAADQRGVSPLHACAMHALLVPARLLLARGANREARDCRQRRATEVASLLGYVDLARELSAPRPRVVPLRGAALPE
ncbi:MAG TPA: ankyrin repeat domain-containing protein [Rhodanobacteraceae bacterium]|nr:ankyrin repeat domain-containing protein [Rhodanobacteraceae bacterium]